MLGPWMKVYPRTLNNSSIYFVAHSLNSSVDTFAIQLSRVNPIPNFMWRSRAGLSFRTTRNYSFRAWSGNSRLLNFKAQEHLTVGVAGLLIRRKKMVMMVVVMVATTMIVVVVVM